jgi:hypothetical protein
MDVVITPSTPRNDDEATSLFTARESSRAKEHAATSQHKYVCDHIHFMNYQSKQVLLIDLTNCAAAEVERILRAVPEFVSTHSRSSVLILSDFTGASLDLEAIRIMKETAVFNKPYVKKSAWTGTENFPVAFAESVRSFSRRDFPVFQTRKEALAWLVMN